MPCLFKHASYIRDMSPVLISVIVAAILALLMVLGLRYVPPGQSWTVHRRGQFRKALQPGLHFVVPLLDRIAHKIDMKGRAMDLHCEQLATKDQRPVIADGMVYFQVLDARKAADKLSTLNEAAHSLCESTAREMVEQLTMDSLSDRSSREINSWLVGMVNQSALQWGVRVTRIDLAFKQQPKRPITGEALAVSDEPPTLH